MTHADIEAMKAEDIAEIEAKYDEMHRRLDEDERMEQEQREREQQEEMEIRDGGGY